MVTMQVGLQRSCAAFAVMRQRALLEPVALGLPRASRRRCPRIDPSADGRFPLLPARRLWTGRVLDTAYEPGSENASCSIPWRRCRCTLPPCAASSYIPNNGHMLTHSSDLLWTNIYHAGQIQSRSDRGGRVPLAFDETPEKIFLGDVRKIPDGETRSEATLNVGTSVLPRRARSFHR